MMPDGEPRIASTPERVSGPLDPGGIRALHWSHTMSEAAPSEALPLPAGTVTFLLTDIERSTSLWQEAPEAMATAVARHYEILYDVVAAHAGVRPEEQGEGDSIVAAFSRASDAVHAALEAQRRLRAEAWPTPRPIRVRMAIHTGEARLRGGGNYVGIAVIRTARLRSLATGAQVLIASSSRDLAIDHLDDSIVLRDLGDHRLKDLARPERVYQLAHADIESDFEPLRSLDATPNNLPVRLSTFIGRNRELVAIDQLISSHRLITITGTGGAGKTRLALQGAANAVERFPDGVWWIELAPLTEAAAVAAKVAEVVGAVVNESQDHLATIAARIGSDRVLLVVDNCEHVLDACADLVETLLQRCPHLVVVTTSRTSLDVPGEVTWRVPPLSLPEPGTAVSVQQLGQFDAVHLFADRSRDARPTFALSDENASDVAAICHQLSGIPLAIELAAARTKTMLPAQILAGLTDALRLLTGGSRRVLPRQQTLDASVRWSCELLGEHERALLFRLSVFSGSFDLPGAEAVCTGDGLDVMSVLDAVERLVDSSLVAPVERDGLGRFTVLETVRQYGARQLAEGGVLELWHERHARYFAAIVERVGPACETQHQFASVEAVSLDYGNIRAALTWLFERGDADRLGPMVLDLGAFWDVSGARTDAAFWCTRALGSIPDEPGVLRARLLALRAESRFQIGEFRGGYEDGDLAWKMGLEVGDTWAAGRGSAALTTVLGTVAFDAWSAQWAESDRLHREAGDVFSLARLRTWRGVPQIRRGMTRTGAAALAEAGPQVRATGQPMLIASQRLWEGYAAVHAGELVRGAEAGRAALASKALGGLSRIALAELVIGLSCAYRLVERPSSRAYLERAERAHRENDPLRADIYLYLGGLELLHEDPAECRRVLDAWAAAHPKRGPVARCTEGVVAAHASFALGDLDDAAARAADLLRWAKAGQNVIDHGRANVLMGAVSLAHHDTRAAEQHAREALATHTEHGNHLSLCDAIELLSAIATECRDDVEAATLLGAVTTMRLAMGSPRGYFIDLVPGLAETLQKSMGDDAFEAARAAGAALHRDGLLAFIERTRGARGRPSVGWNSLTPTELRVAELVRAGLTNREIGERLIMATETVKAHVAHIFAKLGISRRAQLAALATERS